MSNLAEFLIEVWSVDKRAFLDLRVNEVFIPSDKERAQEFLHLHSYVHGHGDYKVEEDHEGEEVCKHLQILKQRQEHLHSVSSKPQCQQGNMEVKHKANP